MTREKRLRQFNPDPLARGRRGSGKHGAARLAILLCVLALVDGCNQTAPNGQSLVAANRAPAATTPVHPSLPVCPPGGASILQSNPSIPGHHKLLLSWNASVASAEAEDNAVGYCLYRSRTKKVAGKNPLCHQCERINQVPVTSTSCIDDLVQDEVTYYYVVAAINQAGRLSAASNEIAAVIPSANKPARPFDNTPALCRTGAASK